MSNLLSVYSMPLSRSHQSPVSPWGKTTASEELTPATAKDTSAVSRVLLQRQISLLSQKKNQTGTFWGKVKEIFAFLCKPLAALRRVLKTRVKIER